MTRFLSLIMPIDKDRKVHVHVDRAHAIHSDGRVYGSMCVTIGQGRIINVCRKLESGRG